jgi:RimJ/RimL family protein N-acetyltransferase
MRRVRRAWYWLAPESRGGSIATWTLRLLAGYAFENLAVARLEMASAPDNVASQRVAERCGVRRRASSAHTSAAKRLARHDGVQLLLGELR